MDSCAVSLYFLGGAVYLARGGERSFVCCPACFRSGAGIFCHVDSHAMPLQIM